jgi:hypothetical protein
MPHESSAAPVSLAVTAGAELVADGSILRLAYAVRGDLSQLAIPSAAVSRRAGRLWERTCFEAFVALGGSTRYWELNFSPSTEWAAYEFEGYRAGMRSAALESGPVVTVRARPEALDVTASVAFAARATASSPWRLGLTAVLQDTAGRKSYWALRHPRATPDFHDAGGFVLALEGKAR